MWMTNKFWRTWYHRAYEGYNFSSIRIKQRCRGSRSGKNRSQIQIRTNKGHRFKLSTFWFASLNQRGEPRLRPAFQKNSHYDQLSLVAVPLVCWMIPRLLLSGFSLFILLECMEPLALAIRNCGSPSLLDDIAFTLICIQTLPFFTSFTLWFLSRSSHTCLIRC